MLVWPPLQPGELKDFDIIWTLRLAGDTISSSNWSAVSPVTVPPVVTSSQSFITTDTKIWMTGGVANQIYTITNTIVTAGGRTLIETVQFLVDPLVFN